jgi:glycosyltransferase involved in cell wall biosynthesis
MKVLMIGPSRKGNGGMATVVNNYFNSKILKDIDLVFMSSTIDGHIIIRLLYNFVALSRIFLTLIFDRAIHIVHVHMSHRGSFYRKALIISLAKLMKKKVIIHLHSSQFDIFYERECSDKAKKYVEKIFQKADYVVVLSEEWKEKIDSWFKCNSTVLYNAIFINEKNEYKNNSNNITLLGRLNERKGLYDLIQVVEPICKKFPEIKFALAGDGDLGKLRSAIEELRISDNVKILGWIGDKERDLLLRDTLVYVLPSYNEGMPMSILEAMSYGVPVLASNVGGIPKVIVDGNNGYMINPGDIKALEDKLCDLLGNSELREKFSEASYKTVKETFDIEAHVNKLLSLYNSLK